jgi:mannose-6-phosphate isomerase-like protein (cupin superfamily)
LDIVQVKREWRERGFSCDIWIDPPGRVWEDYVHDVDELLMVVQGQLEVEIEGQARRAETGQEIFIPARACHTVRNVGGTTARWLYGYRR